MLSGADLRQALQAGLWEALADGSERAAMRATCRDARDIADELHGTAVLTVGPGTWDSVASIAAYHRRLGAVRSMHVVYNGGWKDGARAAHFMAAYSAALGAPLPAAECSISVPCGRQLPTPLAAVLLQHVVPHVERLDMALDNYFEVDQLLQALEEPCAHLCSLRLLLGLDAQGPALGNHDVRIPFASCPGALEALCRLPRLHTLSGPWVIEAPDLQRLCDALPSLTTLGVKWLNLYKATGACISSRLHTLAAWCHSAGHESMRLDRPWHLLHNTCYITHACHLQAALPAVQHLDALCLKTGAPRTEDMPAIQAATQHCAACAERWAWRVVVRHSAQLQVLRGMPSGSLAALQHLAVDLHGMPVASVAVALASLVSAAPNITTLAVCCVIDSYSTEALMQPLRQAGRLRTLWIAAVGPETAAQQAALLEGVVRCLARPGAEGGDEYCRALRHVLLHDALPDALAACRAQLAYDGICMAVGACDLSW